MKILIIEDNFPDYEILREELKKILAQNSVQSYKISEFIRDKFDAYALAQNKYDIAFIDYDLWGDENGGMSFGEKIRNIAPDAFLVLITNYLPDAKKSFDVYKTFNKSIQKRVETEELKDVFLAYFNLKRNREANNRSELLASHGPKQGIWNDKSQDSYSELWKAYESIKKSKLVEVEKRCNTWYEIVMRFSENWYYKCNTRSFDWRANKKIGNEAIKNNMVEEYTINKLAWRRIVLRLMKETANLPKLETHQIFEIKQIDLLIEQLNISKDEYSMASLATVPSLCAIENNGMLFRQKKTSEDENVNVGESYHKSFTYHLGFERDHPYFVFKVFPYSESIFPEEEAYLSSLDH